MCSYVSNMGVIAVMRTLLVLSATALPPGSQGLCWGLGHEKRREEKRREEGWAG